MAESPRIEELRRRVANDPASIAFAQLAEEYRRSGDFEEAVRVCRTGLAQHPHYLSARVTLARALIELQQFDEARTELDFVVRAAPDNLAAIRALAEIHQRREELDEVPKQVSGGATVVAEEPPSPSPPPDYTRALAALDSITVDHRSASVAQPEHPPSRAALQGDVADSPAAADPALGELESWLDAIVADRNSRG